MGLHKLFRHIIKTNKPYELQDCTVKPMYFQNEYRKGRLFHQDFKKKFNLDLAGKTILEIGTKCGGMSTYIHHQKCKFVIGVDLDYDAIVYARSRINQKGIDFVASNAQKLGLKDSSIDIIVSDAVFEHITDMNQCLKECYRVLKSNGRLYVKYSPSWYSYNGAHLIKCITIPWVHLLFSKKTILNVLYYYYANNIFPRSYIERKIYGFLTIGRLSVRKFLRLARENNFCILYFKNHNVFPLKKLLTMLPIFNELFAGNISFVLQKNKYRKL